MGHTLMSNFGAHFASRYAGGGTAVAAGTGDATKVTGTTVDRRDFYAGALVIAFSAVLAATKTVSFAVEIQESADGSTWGTAEALQAATVAETGESGGSTEVGTVQINVNYLGRKRYVRFNVTPDLSNTATDTLAWRAAAILGGANTLPAV